MTPNVTAPTGVLQECDDDISTQILAEKLGNPGERKLELVWRNIIIFACLHTVALYGLYLCFTQAKGVTVIFEYIVVILGGLGITAGAHRLWGHRAYKANLPLRVLLTLLNTIAFQNSVIEWSRDHRIHHKYSETDADPHNAKRGFFFSHIGWLLCRKHPEVKRVGQGIDMSDLEADPILRFQHKHYMKLVLLCTFIVPIVTPMYFWNETFVNAFCVTILRYVYGLNMTWLVNSAAHMWGSKPYDRFINPAENTILSFIVFGEGFHNYHHTFPWDYKTSELGNYTCNWTTAFIDFFAKIGWAYDVKTVSAEMINKRVLRTGDGSHQIWGWGDKDQPKEDYEDATILYKKRNQS